MAELTQPDRPVLRDIPDVELMKVGTWPLASGTATFTTEDLAAAVAASQSTAVSRPVIKLGHSDPRFDGEPAVGFVDNLRLADNGSTLVGDLRGLPAWLADIMPSAYPNRSIEGFMPYQDQTGKVWDFALTGLALLGVSPPAVGTLSSLRDVASLYEVTAGRDGPAEGISIMPGAPLHAAASVEDVRRSFYENGPGTDFALWIEEMFLNPAEVIVMNDETGQLAKYPFTLNEDDTITWGEGADVKREYVTASAHTPDARFTSAAESRPDQTTTAPAEDPATDEEEPMPEFTEDQTTKLLEALGLDEGADAAAIVTAVEELATKPAVTASEQQPGESLAASAKARGMKLVEASAWTTTQDRLTHLERRENERVVDDAVRAGKLMPVSRDRALTQLQAGLLTADDIEALEPVVTMAGQEVGHSQDVGGGADDDVRNSDIYKNWQ